MTNLLILKELVGNLINLINTFTSSYRCRINTLQLEVRYLIVYGMFGWAYSMKYYMHWLWYTGNERLHTFNYNTYIKVINTHTVHSICIVTFGQKWLHTTVMCVARRYIITVASYHNCFTTASNKTYIQKRFSLLEAIAFMSEKVCGWNNSYIHTLVHPLEGMHVNAIHSWHQYNILCTSNNMWIRWSSIYNVISYL